MPEASGLSGIVNGPPLDVSAVQNFGEQLVRMKQMKLQSDQESLKTASQIAQFDPELAQQIGGKALKDMSKGKPVDELYFTNIFNQAQAAKKQQADEAAAKLEQTKASTAESQAAAGEAQSRTILNQESVKTQQVNRDFQIKNQAIEQRVAANAYPDTDEGKAQRIADATIVGIQHGLSAETIKQLGLSPSDAAKVQANMVKESDAHLVDAKLEAATTALNMGMTPDQVNEFNKTGQLPKNATTIQKQTLQATLQRNAVEWYNAATDRLNAEANVGLKNIEEKKYDSEVMLNLAKAKQLQSKGVTTDLDSLLKMIDTAAQAGQRGVKIDKSITDELQKQLAAHLGGTPDDATRWFGLLKNNGFKFPDMNAPNVSAVDQSIGGTSESSARKFGEATRNLPSLPGAVVSGAAGAVGADIKDYLSALGGFTGKEKGETQRTASDQTINGQKIPAGSEAHQNIDGSITYKLPDGTTINVPRQK